MKLTCFRVGVDLTDIEGKWRERYGVGEAGAVLVRPDGFVAWRAAGASETAAAALAEVWKRILAGSGAAALEP